MSDQESFIKFMLDNKVKQETIDVLLKDGLDDLELITYLDPGYVKKLKLNTGQTVALSKAISKLSDQPQDSEHQHTEPAKTSDTGAESDAPPAAILPSDLRRFPGNLDQLMRDVQASDRTIGDAGADLQSDPWLDGRPTGKSIKALLVQDFCGLVIAPRNDRELAHFDGATLVAKGGPKRPQPHETTIAQYLVGSTRILASLLQNNQLQCTVPAILGYLRYQVKIGEYLQSYSKESVMLFDQEFRLQQAGGQLKWGDDSLHLGLKYLKSQQNPATQFARPSARAPGPRNPRTGVEICRNFQTPVGCSHINCKFSHVCMKAGCYKPHPEHKHNQL